MLTASCSVPQISVRTTHSFTPRTSSSYILARTAQSYCALARRGASGSLYATSNSQSFAQQSADVDQVEADRRLAKAVGLIQTAEDLAPYDRVGFSAPLTIW